MYRLSTTVKFIWLGQLVTIGLALVLLPTTTIALNATAEQIKGALYPLYEDADCVGPSCVCTGSSTSLSGADNEEKSWNYLRAKGLTPEQAAGVMGNLKLESGFQPDNQENSQPWPNGGWGIAQWTAGRRDTLRDAVIAAGLPYTNEQTPPDQIEALLAFQLDFLYNESNERTMRDDSSTKEWIGLTRVQTIEEAVIYWEYNFERAGVPALGQRLTFANDIFLLYGSRGVSGGAGNGACAALAGSCPEEATDRNSMVEVQGIVVHPCISEEVDRIVSLANAQGLDMGGGGWRDNATQISLREAHGCGGSLIYDNSCTGRPPTAVPGYSRHERGSAVDFTCDGEAIPERNHPCFIFLSENTSLINLPSEPWHWSIDGS